MPTLTRVAKTAAAALEHTFYVGETGTDAAGAVTVAITDANGAAIAGGSGNATSAGQGRYTFALPAQAQLQLLTVAWSGTIAGTAVTETDLVEIVGGFFFSIAEGRASDSSLSSLTKYPTARLVAARLEVEQECEEICDRAFVPRYRRAVLDGTGTSDLMLVGDNDIRTIRAVRIAPEAGETFVALTAAELAKLVVTPDRVVTRVDGATWTEGRSNLIIEYEVGLDRPPEDLVRAAKVRFRSLANVERTNIPDRAISFTTAEGASYRLTTPDAYETGIPFVDAVYARYSLRSGAGTAEGGRGVPASRTLNFDPQRSSLFHGGVR
ncbi:MAG TPA: hypothetical protein VGX25_04035 [Actinophytocola sp.]|uniref:hypothetical protein n=1 Tax=Actinophytocola sp. TaxID=1872138 RepID=UPI002DDD62F5|nr:hypothetical protein [Actinophytocola sp.]HEV2778548.1 hypothetical protein [Actinophytocola sp.]